MSEAIKPKEFIAMTQGAVEKIRESHPMLSQLDSAIGDGDHGTTMLRAMNRIAELVPQQEAEDLHKLLSHMGWTLMGIDGGATGPLLGCWFMGMAEVVGTLQELDGNSLAAMFEGGLAEVRKQTKAQLGDKTMLDALIPATEALNEGAKSGTSILEMLRSAAEAAGKGAESTKNFTARYGRAKNLGDRTLGIKDPGASSMALIFKGFYTGLLRLQSSPAGAAGQ